MNGSNALMYITMGGILVGLLISIFVVKYFNKDGKFKTKYDEKQEIARGKGFMYGFYAMMIYEAFMAVISLGDFELPIYGVTVHFLGIFIGIVVLETYCIFKDAFIGLNTNGPRYAAVCVVIAVVNLAAAFTGFAEESFLESVCVPTKMVSLLCGLMFAVIGVEILIKRFMDKHSDEEV